MEFKDKTINKVVTKRDLIKAGLWGSLFLQSSFNFVKMQGIGWAYAIIPVLKKIHTNKDDLKASLKMHLEFYNNNPFMHPFVVGIVLAMEEAKESLDLIRSIKISTMGPLGGIGDALTWFTLLPITVSIGASMAINGSAAGPFVFLILFNGIIFSLRYFLVHYGYKTGLKAVSNMKSIGDAMSHGASIVGLTVIGGLIASFVNFNTPLSINLGDLKIALQVDVLDKVMPGLLAVSYTFLMYYGLKKSVSPITLIIITIIFGLVGKLLGFL